MSRLIDAERLKKWFIRGKSYTGDYVIEVIDGHKITEDRESYQKGYEDGFREGRTRKELSDALLPSE